MIDIGSNSVRLVAYDGLSRAPTPLYNEKILCGLGRGVFSTGRLSEEASRRALDALVRFHALCGVLRVGRVFVLATAAVRDAENGAAFIAAAEAILGQPVELVSGRREAALSALGVISGFAAPDGIVGDLGGGSLEMVDVRGFTVGQGVTMPLGGLALQDLSGDAPKKARRIAREHLRKAEPQIATMRGRTFYAVGGTWRALARLHQIARGYPIHVMHGYGIAPDDLLRFLDTLDKSGTDGLEAIDGVPEARRPLLAYGAVVLDEIVRAGSPRTIAISALGVREGLLFEQLDRESQALDPLIAACRVLDDQRARSPGHGEDLCAWSDGFVETLDGSETLDERRLRHAACLLSDINWRAHPDYRGEQGVNIIANAAFTGIDHPGRAYLALAGYFRHEGIAPEKASAVLRDLAGQRLIDRARLVAALLRVAFPVTAGMAGVLPRAPLLVEDGKVVLRLGPDLRALDGERVLSRVRALARLLGREGRVETA